jgi:hypothetical protein
MARINPGATEQDSSLTVGQGSGLPSNLLDVFPPILKRQPGESATVQDSILRSHTRGNKDEKSA